MRLVQHSFPSMDSCIPSKLSSMILHVWSAALLHEYVTTSAAVFCTITIPFLSSMLVTATASDGRLSKKSFLHLRYSANVL